MSQDEATLISEEIKSVAIAIIELRLSGGIGYNQSISQSVSQQKTLLNKKFLKFHINLVVECRVDLKTFLSLTNTA